MKFKNNEKGFSTLAVSLLMVVLVILGATGWLVYDRQKNSRNKESDNSTQSEQPITNQNTGKKTENIDTNNSDSNSKYLIISEWGIKVPLTDSISDLTYVVDGNALFLNSNTFAKYSNNECKTTNKSDYLGHVQRSKDVNQDYNGGKFWQLSDGVKVGEYYIVYFRPIQMYCQQEPLNQKQIDYFMSVIPIIKSAFQNITVN